MKIYDCFQFFNEENVLDLRFNILDEFVDFFVLLNPQQTIKEDEKKLNFDIKNLKNLRKKLFT